MEKKKYTISVFLDCMYEIVASSEEEACQIAENYFSEAEPEYYIEEVEDVEDDE